MKIMKNTTVRQLDRGSKALVILGAGLCFIAIFIATTLPANAAIKCKGQFQVIKGHGQISTPYCEDNYLAAIARSYGRRVSNVAVRQNPSVKAEICRQIGHDSRLTEICSGHRPDGNNKRPF